MNAQDSVLLAEERAFLESRTRAKRATILALILLFVAGLCTWFVGYIRLTNPTWRTAKAPTQPIKVSLDALKRHVRTLASSPTPRNADHPEALQRAARYIKHTLQTYGYKVRPQAYQVGQVMVTNLIARTGPPHGAQVIVGAHYDVCGNTPGADDNASGVAGLLELARLLKPHGARYKRPLSFIAYTLEEPPYFRTPQMGSAVHAKSLHQRKIPVKAMLSLEMLGVYSDKPRSQRYPTSLLSFYYPDVGDFIGIISNTTAAGRQLVRTIKRNMRAASPLPVISINAAPTIQGIDYSDHRNYWKYGYPAVMVTDTGFFRNRNYHRSTDTPETLDYKRMAQAIKGLAWAIHHLSSH